MLALFARAKSLKERADLFEEASRLLARRIGELERGEVDPRRLLVKRTLSKAVEDYTVETRTALAARQLERAGARVHPGEQVGYIITDSKSKERSRRVKSEPVEDEAKYDAAEYVRLLREAAAEVMG
jgi:DNA polymerase elongation subunit (family B)